MQGHKDNQQISDNNSKMEIAIKTVLGDRADQQDSFGYELKQEDGLVVVCDGMGGEAMGEEASLIVCETLKKYHDILVFSILKLPVSGTLSVIQMTEH